MKKNKIWKCFRNYTVLFLGFAFVIGITFAATTIWDSTDPNIKNKEPKDIITSSEFNRIVHTLKNIYNDGSRIGINQQNPQSTLDIKGGLTVRNYLPPARDDERDDCSTLGTNAQGKLECHSSYAWHYSGWSGCSRACGGGSHHRTAICKRDDGIAFGNHTNSLALRLCGTPVLSGSCNTQSCCTPTSCKSCNASGNHVNRPNGTGCTKNGKSGWCSSGQCGAYFWDVCSGRAGRVRCWKSRGNGVRAGSYWDRYCRSCRAGVNSGGDSCTNCPNIDGSGAGEWSHWKTF